MAKKFDNKNVNDSGIKDISVEDLSKISGISPFSIATKKSGFIQKTSKNENLEFVFGDFVFSKNYKSLSGKIQKVFQSRKKQTNLELIIKRYRELGLIHFVN